MNVVVIGANGQLGSDVVSAFAESQDNVASMTHAEIEISNLESVRNCLEKCSPAIVVNTAAMHHVENCELDTERAYAVNATGVRNLALVTRHLEATLIHVSTDYVFDGKKNAPYTDLGALRETCLQSEGRTELRRPDAGVGANTGSSTGCQ